MHTGSTMPLADQSIKGHCLHLTNTNMCVHMAFMFTLSTQDKAKRLKTKAFLSTFIWDHLSAKEKIEWAS